MVRTHLGPSLSIAAVAATVMITASLPGLVQGVEEQPDGDVFELACQGLMRRLPWRVRRLISPAGR